MSLILKHNGTTNSNIEITDNGIKNTSQSLELTSNGQLYKFPTSIGTFNQVLTLGATANELEWATLPTPSFTPQLVEPFTIGDRGYPTVYPENTLAGFEYCLTGGIYQIQFMVRKTRDEQIALFFDSTVDRTTTSSGNVNDFLGVEIKDMTLEAGSSSRNIDDYYVSTPQKPALLDDVFKRFDRSIWYFIEAGDDILIECYEKALQYGLQKQCVFIADQYVWCQQLLSAHPDAIVCFLAGTNDSITPSTILTDGLSFIEVDPAMNTTYLNDCNTAGLKWIVYLINTQKDYNDFITLGATGVLSEDPMYVSNKHTKLTIDPYDSGKWYIGIHTTNNTKRPKEIVNGGFVIDNTDTNNASRNILLNFASPLQNPNNFTLTYDFDVGISSDPAPWIGISFGIDNDDDYYLENANSKGYTFIHKYSSSNKIVLYKRNIGSIDVLDTDNSGIYLDASRTGTLTLNVTPTTISVNVNGNTITVNDTTYRGPYIMFSYRNYGITWDINISNITIT